jgi:serine/threonine protein kinase
LHAWVEAIDLDSSREPLPGRLENLQSYLNTLAELGKSEPLSAEIVLAQYQLRYRSHDTAEVPQFDELSRRDRAVQGLSDQHTSEPATGSVLGRLGDMAASQQPWLRPVGRHTKVAPRLPRKFGRYRLLEELGRGAMGTVYLARDTQLQRHVALKVPLARHFDADEAHNRHVLDRFYHEAHAAAILRHPNLCPVYDVGEIDGVPYLTMAYVKGVSLSQYIERNRPIAPRWAAILVRKLALALQAAHDKGVVHRDLKPSNVMICEGDEPMIMDFGLAWRLDRRDSDRRLTRHGVVLGTPAYMAPEQLSGRVEDLGPRCDVYSLGVILYELLTGRCPFEGPEAVVLANVLFVAPDRPSRRRPDLDPGLEAICQKAMSKRDEERHATMSELAVALGAYLRRGTTTTPSSVPTLPPPAADDAQTRDSGSADEPQPLSAVHNLAGPVETQVNDAPVAVLPAAGLLRSWRQWTATVASFALGRKSRRARDPKAFRTVRNQLLATLRARASDAPETERGFYLSMEQLVSPWVSVYSLAREDREILQDLLARCQHVDWILESRSARRGAVGWLFVVSIVLAVAFALLLWGLVIK